MMKITTGADYPYIIESRPKGAPHYVLDCDVFGPGGRRSVADRAWGSALPRRTTGMRKLSRVEGKGFGGGSGSDGPGSPCSPGDRHGRTFHRDAVCPGGE